MPFWLFSNPHCLCSLIFKYVTLQIHTIFKSIRMEEMDLLSQVQILMRELLRYFQRKKSIFSLTKPSNKEVKNSLKWKRVSLTADLTILSSHRSYFHHLRLSKFPVLHFIFSKTFHGLKLSPSKTKEVKVFFLLLIHLNTVLTSKFRLLAKKDLPEAKKREFIVAQQGSVKLANELICQQRLFSLSQYMMGGRDREFDVDKKMSFF